jgi:predicted nucleic acid-binding Zn ribbon protein
VAPDGKSLSGAANERKYIMSEPCKELLEIEARGDEMVAAGFESERDAEESNEFERRVMGIPSRECPCCGAEVSRNQRRCGDCDTRL